MYIIAVHSKAMHAIPVALYIKCTYLIAVRIALRPNTPGELKACTRTALRNYTSSKFNGQRSLCPSEAISPQSSMVKRRYVRQKLYQLKVQRTNVAMSPETISAPSSKDKHRYVRQKLYQLKVQRANVAVPCNPSVPG